jgi:acyl-CoA synthetase (NDP forming)
VATAGTALPSVAAATRKHQLERLINPRSIAIVGASERNHYSTLAMTSLRGVRFDGALHLVNRRGSAYGQACAVDCRSIGEAVDAAYLCVPYDAVLDSARDAIAAGIRNLVIVSSGFAELGHEGARREAELKAMCDAEDVRVLGPNCLGFRNTLDRVALGSIPFVEQPVQGSIAVVSVSGSVATWIANYGIQQGIGFTHIITVGNEMNVGTADLIGYLIDIPEVQAITLFLEAVKDAGALTQVAMRARTARKPIVAVKAGAAPATAAIAAAHTSAVVGDDRVFDAACDRLGIVRVGTFEDLVATAATIAATGPIDPCGVALVSMSGGVCGVASDYGAQVGVRFPEFSEATRAELGRVLSEFGQMNNPLDLTGAAVRDESLWTSVPTIVSRDPAVGLTLINWDVPAVAQPTMPQTLALIGEAHKGTATPTLIVTNFERPVNEHGIAYLQKHGLRFALPGIGHGMNAVAQLAWWSQHMKRPASVARDLAADDAVARPRNEHETLEHLARHGVPVVPTRVARSAAEAASAVDEIDGPIVMKVLSPDIPHKSEVGGVVLNIQGPQAAEKAYNEIMRSIATNARGARIDGVLLTPMRVGGLELLVGAARDPQWGLVMAVGLGGIWVEALNDTALCLLPAESADLRRALCSLRAAKLFGGYRGSPPADLDAIASVAARIGDAALALGPELTALEVNPLFIRGHQVEALDALATWAT